jgi:hypothetical protein
VTRHPADFEPRDQIGETGIGDAAEFGDAAVWGAVGQLVSPGLARHFAMEGELLAGTGLPPGGVGIEAVGQVALPAGLPLGLGHA